MGLENEMILVFTQYNHQVIWPSHFHSCQQDKRKDSVLRQNTQHAGKKILWEKEEFSEKLLESFVTSCLLSESSNWGVWKTKSSSKIMVNKKVIRLNQVINWIIISSCAFTKRQKKHQNKFWHMKTWQNLTCCSPLLHRWTFCSTFRSFWLSDAFSLMHKWHFSHVSCK